MSRARVAAGKSIKTAAEDGRSSVRINVYVDRWNSGRQIAQRIMISMQTIRLISDYLRELRRKPCKKRRKTKQLEDRAQRLG